MCHRMQTKAGFSLIELMIALAVIGILAGLALPAYQQQIVKTRRSLAKGELMAVVARQEQYFINHKQYAASLDLLGYAANPYAMDASGNDVGLSAAGRIYKIELESISLWSFSVRAIPQLNQVKDKHCGTLTLTSAGAKSASLGVLNRCW